MNGMMGGMAPMMVVMCVVGVLLIAGLVVGIVLAVRAITGDRRGPDPSDAVSLLEERYARGEIDREEFVERRDALRSQRP